MCKALKFGVIFQKFALKLLKICKIIEKTREKCKFFGKFFNFCAVHHFLIIEKIMNIISTGYNGASGAEPHEGWKFFTKFVKIGNGNLKN